MATKKIATPAEEKDTAEGAVVVAAQFAVSAPVDDSFLEQFAGSGMDGADAESFAIPFLAVLQKTSPVADPDDAAYIEGARAGMLFETVSRSMYDSKAGVHIVPCAYKREFIRWGADDGNETYKGAYTPEAVVQMREEGTVRELDNRLYFPLPDGTVSEKKCDRLSDTRNHYILLLNPDGGWVRALMSLSSTQIKKSKHLMSALSNVKLRGAAGMYTPPTFASVVLAQTKLEQNDKGSWHGLQFSLVDRARKMMKQDIFNDAKAFYEEVRKGSVAANYDAAQAAQGQGPAGAADAADGF